MARFVASSQVRYHSVSRATPLKRGSVGRHDRQRSNMRVVYGFLALCPFLLFAYAFIVLARTHDAWPDWFWFGVPISVYVVIGIYLWNVWRNPSVPREKRALWTALIVFGNIFVLPFYFAFYIWPASSASSTP